MTAAGARAFLHVPKCAGSSVTHALELSTAPGALAPQRFDDTILCGLDDPDVLAPQLRGALLTPSDPLDAVRRHEFVCGHFALPTLLRITSADRIATIVREPRARILSLYAYWALEDFSLWRPYEAHRHAERELAEFLSEPEIAPVVDNQLVRLLLKDDARIPVDDFIAEADVAGLARDALAALRALGFVGVQELPEGMWEGLSRVFGVSLEPARVNVTATQQGVPRCPPIWRSLSPQAIELLDRRTEVERRIYERLLADRLGTRISAHAFADAALARQFAELGAVLGHVADTPGEPIRHP